MTRAWLKTLLTIVVIAAFCAAAPCIVAQSAPASLQPYTTCRFDDGLQVVQVDPLRADITSREVDTDSGPREVDVEAGLRIMFAYPGTDFYANVKAELLPATEYPQLKQYLLENFDHLAHGNKVNAGLRSPLNGFEAHGLDREKLEGGVLGFYLLFDNSEHVATTIYLLNQEPQARKFQTLGEYGELRDRFLAAYTACIRSNQKK